MRRLVRARARTAFQIQRVVRGGLGFAVSAVFVVLLWRGWFPDLRIPGASAGRAAAAAVLTIVLAGKIAARVRTSERRRTARREAFSDAELAFCCC